MYFPHYFRLCLSVLLLGLVLGVAGWSNGFTFLPDGTFSGLDVTTLYILILTVTLVIILSFIALGIKTSFGFTRKVIGSIATVAVIFLLAVSAWYILPLFGIPL